MRSSLSLSLVILVSMSSIAAAEEWRANGVPLTRAPGGAESHVAIPDGEGGVISAWTDFRSGRDIYAQRVNGLGVVLWTLNGVGACTAVNDQENASIASDGAGGVILAWRDKRAEFENPSEFYPFDIYAQRINGEGTVVWAANGIGICNESGNQEWPCVISDGAGGAVIAWQDERDGPSPAIYAQHINDAGQAVWPTAGGTLVGRGWRTQYRPQGVWDNNGGAIIAYQEMVNGQPSMVVQRVGGAGGFGDGVTVSATSDFQWDHRIVADGSGGAVVAWRDQRNGSSNTDIYAQRVTNGGTASWTSNGVALCAATKQQSFPQLVEDGTGGAIVVWDDDRFSTHRAYAQRVNGTGTVLWELDGVRLSGLRDSFAPTLVGDGSGGAMIAWEDHTNWFNNLGSDIYGQHLNASGAPVWTLYGIPISSAGWWERSPQGVPDGFGGAIMVWSDSRESDGYAFESDIYAQRVRPDGSLPTGVSGRAPSLVVSEAYPNPFSAQAALDLVLQDESDVSVEVFDVAGRRVRNTATDRMGAGLNRMTIDGRDQNGHLLPSGVYFYRIHAGNETVTRKMVIAR